MVHFILNEVTISVPHSWPIESHFLSDNLIICISRGRNENKGTRMKKELSESRLSGY